MDAEVEVRKLIQRIRELFPLEAEKTDSWLRERYWDPAEATFSWVEAFADRTSEAVAQKEAKTVLAHTEFMSQEYRSGSPEVRNVIDVAYAENLMWDLDVSFRVWAWPHISAQVRELYESMWGIPKLPAE